MNEIDNRYKPARLLFYFVRKSNKNPGWKNLLVKQISLARPQVMIVNDVLVINNYLRKGWHYHWNAIVTALIKEAEELYPEFKGRVVIFDDEK